MLFPRGVFVAVIVLVLSIGLIVYTYVGYPLLLAVLARLRPRPIHLAPHTPTVTLLIAAYNEAAIIAQKLDNSLALDYPADRLQILVAADGSDDATPGIVAGYANRGVVLSHQPARQGKMAAINRVIPQATGAIIVFSDANNLYRPDTLRELVKPLADPQVGMTSGAKQIVAGDGLLGESEGLYWRYESFIKKQETVVDSCVGVAGEVLAMRRSLFAPPPAEIINDDFYLALRVLRQGYRVVYVPTARSIERVSPTAQDEATRRTRIVAGRYQAMVRGRALLPWNRPLLVWQILSHKYLRPLVPFAMITAFLANLVAISGPGPKKKQARLAQLIFVGQCLFYGLSLLGTVMKVGGKVGKLLYLPTYLVQSNAAAFLGLVRFLSGQQTAQWQRVARRID
jgi:biofilm PGA synthesis N-glycosyltransferase PgaC